MVSLYRSQNSSPSSFGNLRNVIKIVNILMLSQHGASATWLSRQVSSTPSIPYVNVTGSPAGAGASVLESFVAYSFEFAFFPEYAGNLSHPNKFSDQLLENIGLIQGTRPYLRIGGNTQYVQLF